METFVASIQITLLKQGIAFYPQYVNEGKLVEVKVESGKTYYFLTRGLSKGELTVTFGEKATPLELLSLSKEEGTTLNLSIVPS